MSTTFSFTKAEPVGRNPPAESLSLGWPTTHFHDWHLTGVPYIALMDPNGPHDDYGVYGGVYTQYSGYGVSYINSWVSPALADTYTISDNFLFVADFQQNPDVVFGLWPSLYTFSLNLHPGVSSWLYRPSTGEKVATISYGMEEPEYDTTLGTYQTWTISPEDTVITQAGDKIVFEVYSLHSNSVWAGNGTEKFIFGGTQSSHTRVVFPDLDMEFMSSISSSDKLLWNIRNPVIETNKLYYRLGKEIITSQMSPLYYLFGNDYARWYFDDISALRGRFALVIRPRAGNEFDNYVYDYSNKFVFNEPSVHRFFMIDDFEHYDTVYDLTSSWVIDDQLYWYVAEKTYSNHPSIEDYNLLTFKAEAEIPTLIHFIFEDEYGEQSNPLAFILTDRCERYEATVSWAGMDRTRLGKVMISSSDSAHVILDDIAILDAESGSENVGWTKLGINSLKENYDVRHSSFKIPFRRTELIQFGGDNNANGSIKFNNTEMTKISFMNEMMLGNTPLYLRFKNYGMPIALGNWDNKYKNANRGRNSSVVTFNWTEIYDYRMF